MRLDARHGHGVINYANGDRFEGTQRMHHRLLLCGYSHTVSRQASSNGATATVPAGWCTVIRVTGMCVHVVETGACVMRFSRGEGTTHCIVLAVSSDGEWKEDRKHGRFRFVDDHAVPYDEVWKNDVLQSRKEGTVNGVRGGGGDYCCTCGCRSHGRVHRCSETVCGCGDTPPL